MDPIDYPADRLQKELTLLYIYSNYANNITLNLMISLYYVNHIKYLLVPYVVIKFLFSEEPEGITGSEETFRRPATSRLSSLCLKKTYYYSQK